MTSRQRACIPRAIESSSWRSSGWAPTAKSIDEWSTLVDPGPGALGSRIHGITAKDLVGAPSFGDIADDLLARLSGRIIVAHNAPFDVAFLQAETVRAGIAWGPVEGLCTLEVLQRLGITKTRQLHLSCAELGVPAGREHAALDDARAVAGLVDYLGARIWAVDAPARAPFWQQPLVPASVLRRTEGETNTVPAQPEHPARHVHLPLGIGITEAAASTYLGLLDHVLEDGTVTDSEVDALSLFARACGISRDSARRLHLAYLDEMTRVAREDRLVTPEEREYLANMTVLLSRALPH